ncbi:MAG: hypothetical protein ABSE99_16595 [Terracidiphilus sp.]|jgi:hypothetical protein
MKGGIAGPHCPVVSVIVQFNVPLARGVLCCAFAASGTSIAAAANNPKFLQRDRNERFLEFVNPLPIRLDSGIVIIDSSHSDSR